jgi:peptidoglycan hydrolase CwlO-like protein
MDSLTLTVARLEGKVAKMQDDIDEIKGEIAVMKQDITIMKQDIADLREGQLRQDNLLATLSFRSIDHETQLRNLRKDN